jgi:anthranilate phosphoribosyltransferase
VQESATVFMNILEGKGTNEQNAAVIANAAMALFCADQKSGMLSAVARATETLKSGKALLAFKNLMNT